MSSSYPTAGRDARDYVRARVAITGHQLHDGLLLKTFSVFNGVGLGLRILHSIFALSRNYYGCGTTSLSMVPMTVKIPLANKEGRSVSIDQHVYDALLADDELKSLQFFDKLWLHSGGSAFYQRYIPKQKKHTYENIYLHRLIAERFIPQPPSDKKLFVRFIDGNKLNATLANLEWVTMAQLRRHMKGGSSTTGYRGVTLDRSRYRAVVYNNGNTHDLGFFDTPKEAALAYNKLSAKLFGITASLNVVLDADGNPKKED